ncbi:streptophobe family protein [Streptomyces sp. NK08204]|uniref:streptophobe family protein n=1 Tax=Streptomyces sp. NK08204 TaxID=2873260 RepID=UPI0035A981C0
MSAATDAGTARRGTTPPWTDIGLSAIAAVSRALIGGAGTAALGPHLLGTYAAGSPDPMSAAVAVLGTGGSVSPSGDASAFGPNAAEAHTASEITPLGVSLVGALLLSWFFLRSLRAAEVVPAPAELLARADTVVALCAAMTGGSGRAGHGVITIDVGAPGPGALPGGRGGGPDILGLGDVGGLLPDRIGDLVHARAAVGSTVDTAPSVLGGLCRSAGVLLIAALASRRTPLPPAWGRRAPGGAAGRVRARHGAVDGRGRGRGARGGGVRGDRRRAPRRVVGAALLGAPNGVWLATRSACSCPGPAGPPASRARCSPIRWTSS